MTKKEKIKRSVDSLERLYSVVVGLAVTIAVQKILFDKSGQIHIWYDQNTKGFPFLGVLLDRLPAMLAFLFTAVPFYHGMNRHLDRTYVERTTVKDKEPFLVFDFFLFFLESCFLVAIAALVSEGDHLFLVLAVLLVVDAVWSGVTHGIHYSTVKHSTLRWTIINVIGTVTLVVVYFARPFAPEAHSWMLAIVAMGRTIADYYFCWEFYFPSTPRSRSKKKKNSGPQPDESEGANAE